MHRKDDRIKNVENTIQPPKASASASERKIRGIAGLRHGREGLRGPHCPQSCSGTSSQQAGTSPPHPTPFLLSAHALPGSAAGSHGNRPQTSAIIPRSPTRGSQQPTHQCREPGPWAEETTKTVISYSNWERRKESEKCLPGIGSNICKRPRPGYCEPADRSPDGLPAAPRVHPPDSDLLLQKHDSPHHPAPSCLHAASLTTWHWGP